MDNLTDLQKTVLDKLLPPLKKTPPEKELKRICKVYNELIEKQESYPGGFQGFGMGIPILLLGWGILRSVFRRQETFDLPDDRNKIHNLDDGEADNGDGIPR